ncbi:hypothetical protein [Chitinophaga varians]|uniref:hypothetical protein n=1 Tax=Chitinophaga varians TaxID=2202339 RepID=UPI00165F23C3|nr:hypothetical protein [Chitinophaga varians]MBC9910530.1 hypothetical protein [Chitinophaga varians]
MKLYLMIVALLPIAALGQRFSTDLQQIKEVCNSDVSEIEFTRLGWSCQSAFSNTTTFYRKHLSFTTDTSTGNLLSPEKAGKPARTISGLDIIIFTHALPNILKQPMTVEHMEFTQQHYEQCKREIDTMRSSLAGHLQLKLQYGFFRKKGIDYQRLSTILDSLPQIPSATLERILHTNGYSSTTSYAWNMLLKNTNGTYINICHFSNSFRPLLTHWMVTVNGQVSFSNNMEITRFFEKNFPGFRQNDKMELLRWLVMQLYHNPPVNPSPAAVSQL